jgi:hypothetical protein
LIPVEVLGELVRAVVGFIENLKKKIQYEIF